MNRGYDGGTWIERKTRFLSRDVTMSGGVLWNRAGTVAVG